MLLCPKKLGLGIFNWTIKRKNWFDRVAALILCILPFEWSCMCVWSALIASAPAWCFGGKCEILLLIYRKKPLLWILFIAAKSESRAVNWFGRPFVSGCRIFFLKKLDPTEFGSAISRHIGQCTDCFAIKLIMTFMVHWIRRRFSPHFSHSLNFQRINDLFCIDFSRTTRPFDFHSF